MTLNKDTALILQSNPSAVYINLSSNPSIKSLIPTIKSSSKLKVLDETDDYIIVAKIPITTQLGGKPSTINVHLNIDRKILIQSKKHIRFKKKHTWLTHFLKSVGIQAKPIRKSNESNDELRIVNASGIIR